MIKYFCDRCGLEMERSGFVRRSDITPVGPDYDPTVRRQRYEMGPAKTQELCEPCLMSLDIFMTGRNG